MKGKLDRELRQILPVCDYDKNTALVSLGESLERKKDLFVSFLLLYLFLFTSRQNPLEGVLKKRVGLIFSSVSFVFISRQHIFCVIVIRIVNFF